MNRREFLAAGAAGAAALNYAGAAGVSGGGAREYFEWRRYYLQTGSRKNRLGDFLKEAGIAALNRVGVGPVGVFNVVYGPNAPTLHVLLVHKSLESVERTSSELLADDGFGRSDFAGAGLSDPAYVRVESSLMAAFKGMPKLEVPERKERIFELRTYESHSIRASKKKIEMFNEGGEIAIFRKTGLRPVFFGETLIGPQMPNLTYMLAFDDMADRDRSWPVFGNSEDWKKLRSDAAYKDTVSNITDIILRPTSYSQI